MSEKTRASSSLETPNRVAALLDLAELLNLQSGGNYQRGQESKLPVKLRRLHYSQQNIMRELV